MKLHHLLTLSFIGLITVDRLPGSTDLERKAQLGVIAGDVSEIRGTATNGECWIYLNLTGDAAADAHSVRRIRVNRAQDELGRDLIKSAEMPSGAAPLPGWVVPSAADEQRRLEAVAAEVARRRALRESATGVAPSGGLVPPVNRSSRPVIVLRNPSRHSPTIKVIEGEIDLFTPTEANGGIVRLTNLAAHPGEPLPHTALEAQQIQVVYFTREAFETNGKLVGPGVKENYASAFRMYGGQAVGILVRDPKQLAVDLELRGNDGKAIPVNLYSGGNNEWSRALFTKAPPPADAQLIVRIATAGTIRSYPFKLENVPLP